MERYCQYAKGWRHVGCRSLCTKHPLQCSLGGCLKELSWSTSCCCRCLMSQMSTVCPCFDVQLVEWQESMVCLGNNDCKPLRAWYKRYIYAIHFYHYNYFNFVHIQYYNHVALQILITDSTHKKFITYY